MANEDENEIQSFGSFWNLYLLRMENERVIHIQGKSLSLDEPQAREFPQILFLGGCLLVILSQAGIPSPGGLMNKTILEIVISQQKFAIFALEAFRKIKTVGLIDIF